MKKTMMAVVGLAMAVVLTGCRGSALSESPSSVAEDFAKAIIQRRPAEALDLCDVKLYGQSVGRDLRIRPSMKSKSYVRRLKDDFEKDGKKIDDDMLEGVAVMEVIMTPSDIFPKYHLDGKECTGETAAVTIQFVKGKDKKSKGMEVELLKIDGSWKVIGYSMTSLSDDLIDDDD